ncbi:DUF1765-domain-containing protein [Phialemonium atrogriseum]|uniref:DUF1765-domain-containing protein n=1 Tax=Phialemonium atrogriseum TaxID=1093897 RepID=A0AAJ0BWZ1_9PEZI|nr:DUF1765-domain-containing protein [Phialemonium atrogriseum]KAK1764602.1 DUF1765-domain-containing protein [Phialemonium atrogriseum]
MAPAVDPSVPFHRSHSTPDLLSRLADTPPPFTVGSLPRDPHRTLSLKSLPSLPAFDLPSFDFDHAFHATFSLDDKPDAPSPSTTKKNIFEIRTTAEPSVDPSAGKLGRSNSMIDKPRLWLPSSRSTPDVRGSLRVEGSEPKTKDNGATSRDRSSGPEPKLAERSKTVESFAGFARRSWMSRSRSPSPSNKPDNNKAFPNRIRDRQWASSRNTQPKKAAKGASPEARADAAAGAGGGARKEPRSRVEGSLDREASRSTDSLSSTSRALNRASVYLTKIKQRPQSVFVRSASATALSTLSLGAMESADSEGLDSSETASANTVGTTTPAADHHTLQGRNHPLYARDSSHTDSTCTSETGTSSEDASQATTDTALTMPQSSSRDPLWATFRNLDADFNRFAAKNSASAKMGAIRGILVPFLRNTAYHPSNADKRMLTPEDVDRRATILNRWWNGLLEMLDNGQSRVELGVPSTASPVGSPPQPVAGVDRPALLEAATMIMMRPEWRLSTSYFQPLADRSPFERVRARSPTQSSDGNSDHESSDSTFITESAEHNVRTMFAANLLTQMAIVVGKMSMRHAPLSLVNWSGKACAYAFFFVPGVADILVRLWGLNSDLIRRVADEFGLPRRSKGESEDIVALFPPNLGGLGWTSIKTVTDKLRLAPKLPLLTARIPWHGPWVSRWRGGDTDLLFIFCKYYYILAEEFMPADLPLIEKARGPAFVLLHAQLLSTLDSTIHRHAAVEAMLAPPLIDASHGADASIAALSLPPNNLFRGMDENRLVILLKDMLSDNSFGVVSGVKLAFAEAFMALLKSATKRTSRYEHTSCFMLCDFLEEALMTYDSFQNSINNSYATSPREENAPSSPSPEFGSPARPVDLIDWPFWFDVGKMILNSNNTMAEIRMLSFLFAVWDAIVVDPARKESLCIEWLLSEEVFGKFFNNWCPMVRAYYMRLLCWRICRDSGRADELDTRIFLLVSQRLKTVWSHYLWLKQKADAEGRYPPSTAPCYPTPGKRFMIIRTELQTPQPGFLVGFDQSWGTFGNPEGRGAVADYRASPQEGASDRASPSGADGNPTSYKKKWSLLGKVLSLTAGTAAGINTAGRRSTWDDDLEEVRRETAASRVVRAGVHLLSGPPPPPKHAPSSTMTSSSDSTSSTGSAPVYETTQYVFRFTLGWQSQAAAAAGPPRDRVLTRPRLPVPAQARVSARSAAMSRRAEGAVAANNSNGGSAVFRSESPPPIAAGLPHPTRRFSGLAHTGLVSEARNARPLLEGNDESQSPGGSSSKSKRRSMTLPILGAGDGSRSSSDGWSPRSSMSSSKAPTLALHLESLDLQGSSDAERDRGRRLSYNGNSSAADTELNSIQPTRPTGAQAAVATYAGRALAEWSLVVNECNSFVDRRRDEGVLGLSEVEVPTLGVEGLGVRGRPA